ncbi:PI-PLC X domain-containing protein 1-like [Seriola lalandi dorsalis]|uniref:PI-PLC X domain-containing protein 1-like n=1 Tax=Seriola lalandi dorsalis TaxID=1841481 RepID=A0A3B4X7K4_SERLL|nr:PI-PLC X domain-containing protein 1-like [Seriola lalandi dorsalis]XP_056226310.1 PI-PLC X domain-containing protein 1-like [Seriola aureovittata]
MDDEQRQQLGGNADWMSCLPEELLDVPLWNLAIPGSHDSMSFCLDVSSPVLRSQPCLLRVIDRLFPCWTRPCISRWATTQQSVLSDQCDLGIRFLDLRVARKPAGGSKLFFAHGIYTLMTVKEALDELANWLDAHPKEIVIISCSHFESLTDRDHAWLVEYIIMLFRKKLCSSQDTPTLRSCWSRSQQVIVSYGNQQVVLQHPELWTGVPYSYADSPDPEKVIAYLEEQKSRGRPAGFYVSGLNLTEDTPYVLLHPLQTMRKMTLKALSLLLSWTSEQRPGPEGGVNIICCDFVGISQFCSLVIGLNYKLLGRPRTLAARTVCRTLGGTIDCYHSNR